MTGAFLNAVGILIGGLLGLALRKPLGLRTQVFFKSALGAFTVLFGLQLLWTNLEPSLEASLKLLALASGSIVLGFWTGRLLRLQTISNRLGHYAGNLIQAAQKNPPGKASDGLTAAAILFCASPLGILGAVADGLGGQLQLLAVKGVMDALATMAFVRIFRWPATLAAAPVFVFLTIVTDACHSLTSGVLATPNLIHPAVVIVGVITCILPIVIFEVRRVELANFLPALAIAPLLAKLTGWG